MVSNSTLQRPGAAASSPAARSLHLQPSVARLGPDLKCSVLCVQMASRALGLSWAWLVWPSIPTGSVLPSLSLPRARISTRERGSVLQ